MKTVIYPYFMCLALKFADAYDTRRENLRGYVDGIKTKTTRWTGIIHYQNSKALDGHPGLALTDPHPSA